MGCPLRDFMSNHSWISYFCDSICLLMSVRTVCMTVTWVWKMYLFIFLVNLSKCQRNTSNSNPQNKAVHRRDHQERSNGHVAATKESLSGCSASPRQRNKSPAPSCLSINSMRSSHSWPNILPHTDPR